MSRGVLHTPGMLATPAVAGVCAVCGQVHPEVEVPLLSRLWVYTNYDCNLHCSYCLVSSSPTTPRRGLPLETFRRLIDEAVALGCEEVFLTGGEPAILPHIAAMIAYATPRLRTTMLTNGMLWKGPRLARLEGKFELLENTLSSRRRRLPGSR